MNEVNESPELDSEAIEEVAEKSVKIIGKKILKWTGLILGFAATGIVLATILAPEDKSLALEEVSERPDASDEPQAV